MEAGDVLTDLIFLKPDPKYAHEKPYRLRYDPGEAIPRTNCETKVQKNVTIHDIRGKEAEYTLHRNGFQVARLDSKLKPDDFHDRAKVKSVYYPELKELLKQTLGAQRVEVLEHGIRKRHSEFPISTGKDYEHLQPTSIIHIDFTPDAAQATSSQILNVDALAYNRLQTLNVWKPLYGPLTDWPLSVCDSRSISRTRDCIATDVVERVGFTENYQVYYHPDMRFCYLSEQSANEIMLFRQTDTEEGYEQGTYVMKHFGYIFG
ncbi:putative CmcJ-like methyltransferase [Phaeosphaeria sp. MPI-PUGE-AT-0046c]|nr:putative CmcJ-like methyltransferase [Phaeosphaeria sp. MPI-PUGE-AT-0046c]